MSGLAADELARIIDATEMAMVTDWVDALPGVVARRFGAELVRTDGALVLAVPGAATGLFNRVLGLGVFVPARRETVRRLVELYRRLDTPFLVHLNPHARPAELAGWLEEEGLVRGEEWFTGYRYPIRWRWPTASSP